MANWTVNGTKCNPVVRQEYVASAIVSACQIALNIVVIGAAIHGRRILRHNYVYAYVTSTLTANVVFGFCCILTLLSNYLGTETDRIDFEIPWHDSTMRWWSFRKSLTISIFLVMSGNIAALIYGLRESTYFIGKFVARNKNTNVSVFKKSSIRARKNRAVVIITFVWFVPCIASLVPPFNGSCLRNCLCHPGVYHDNICQTNIYQHCSATWLPVSKYFLGFVAGVWITLILFISFLLTTTVKRFVESVSPQMQNKNTTRWAPEDDIQSKKTRCVCRTLKLPPFNHSVKLLISMTVLYVAFTLPAMTIIILDLMSYAYVLNPIAALLMFTLTIVYSFVSPILMVKLMPGLRRAVVNMCSHVDNRSLRTSSKNTDTNAAMSSSRNYSNNPEERPSCNASSNNTKVIEIPAT